MQFSIITISFNRKATIAKAIESVLSQDYKNIQYIVIDGNSTDGTKEIINTYSDKISILISENDNGLYEALNKGMRLATGDLIGIMHSDDEFYDTTVVSQIAAAFQKNPNTNGFYGNGIYVSNDQQKNIIRDRICGEYSDKKIISGWLPLHTSVYLKKNVMEKYGYYNEEFKIASDTELLLRYLHHHKLELTYLNIYFVKMRMGGLSTDYNNFFKVLLEDYRIYKKFGLPAYKIVFYKKILTLKQYLKNQNKLKEI
ncbi:glycosyltransferase family 2 protein [Flavobacterium sp.]|jgi:glycosyltransferase involved in cell wall biosynthesis|uniref:glycosyltransferase family 2 protein n=1 Tax=Flavobacterium sp. TaxID=239 RepID=UPI0037C083E4